MMVSLSVLALLIGVWTGEAATSSAANGDEKMTKPESVDAAEAPVGSCKATPGDGGSCLSSEPSEADKLPSSEGTNAEPDVVVNVDEKMTNRENEGTTTETEPDEVVDEDDLNWFECNEHMRVKPEFEFMAEINTHYQNLQYYWGEEEDDACLFLNDYMHTCASNRPHYHEVFVHYAAHFLDQVKRVVFIGGGDSKVLHEVMKYPSLELVVGLELDHEVPRSSFYFFGTQPHFDNDKVEWYFGDAAKSLSVLPRDYYGSFDLVIVDILTEVAAALKVNDELTLLEAGILLLKPDGIIVKNEEGVSEDEVYVPGRYDHHLTKSLSKYSIDLVYHDVPQYCLQAFVLASNSVDFLNAKPVDHGIETLYLEGLDDFQDQFDRWYNYGVASGEQSSKCSGNMISKGTDSTLSVLMIVEAEQTSIPLESLEDSVVDAIVRVGLTKVDSLASPLTIDEKDGSTIMILAKEGYVTARCVPDLAYCAFDILLYGSAIAKMALVKDELIGAVKSQQISSYRFVLGGMTGRDDGDHQTIGPPSAEELCKTASNGNQDRPRAKERRISKGSEEFDWPEPAFLHSYNNTMALKQWQSQTSVGGQILVQLEVALFWTGEKVLILDGEVWHQGQVKKVLGERKYDVAYGKNDVQVEANKVQEERIKKAPGKIDKGVVEASLSSIAEFIWELAELDADAESAKNNPVGMIHDGTGDGLILAFSTREGTLTVSWDGRSNVTVNFFVAWSDHEHIATVADRFVSVADDVKFGSKIAALRGAVSKEVFPRGTSSVIVFSEIVGDELPIWG